MLKPTALKDNFTYHAETCPALSLAEFAIVFKRCNKHYSALLNKCQSIRPARHKGQRQDLLLLQQRTLGGSKNAPIERDKDTFRAGRAGIRAL